jgi:hypothetical protein
LAVKPFSVQTTWLWIAEVYEDMREIQIATAVRRELVCSDLNQSVGDEKKRADLTDDTRTNLELEQAIKDTSHDVSLWHELCRRSTRTGNIAPAIAFCQAEMERLPSNPLPFFAMCNIHAWKGNYEDAILCFDSHFNVDDNGSLQMYETSFDPSNLVKSCTLKSLTSTLAPGDPSVANMSLYWAAWTGNMVDVERLIENCAGHPTSHVDEPGFTPLHLSAWNMHTGVAIKLA